MRIIVCFALLLPLPALAQQKQDYQNAMSRFQRFYNAGRGDSISAMFHLQHPSTGIAEMWSNQSTAKALSKYGKLRSFKYLGVDPTDVDTVRVFETFFSKAGKKTTSLTLHLDNSLGTFRFITFSDGIAQLSEKRKPSGHN